MDPFSTMGGGMMNPMAFASILAAQNPAQWAPMLDQMAVPLPGTPEFMQLTGAPGPGQQPEQDLGAMLGPDPMGGIVPGTDQPGVMPDPMAPVAPAAPSMAAGPGVMPPAPGLPPPSLTPNTALPPAAGPGRTPVTPQIKAPEQQRPIMAGGVSGAQKAPDFGGKATLQTPAQMMMATLLNRNPDPLRVPSLGMMLRGGKY